MTTSIHLPLEGLENPFSDHQLMEGFGLSREPKITAISLDELERSLETGSLDPSDLLTPDELGQYRHFSFRKRRLEWLGGRLAAKQAAIAMNGGTPDPLALLQWPVRSASDGRPCFDIPGGQAPLLSISHSSGLAAAMVCAQKNCGIDIQRFAMTAVRVRERFCSVEEKKLLDDAGIRIGDVDEPAALTLLWSAKEALRKALGGEPLTGFLAMTLEGVSPENQGGWSFRLKSATFSGEIKVFTHKQRYAIAICAN